MNKNILACSFLVLLPAVAAHGDPPQPVIIETNIVFSEVAEGTFTATEPLCASGVLLEGPAVTNPSVTHGWTVRNEFICDDNSGTFILQYHPQARDYHPPATSPPEFTVSGPWTFWIGTGSYEKFSGHGDFGVVIDFSQEPWTAEETFVGFVQAK